MACTCLSGYHCVLSLRSPDRIQFDPPNNRISAESSIQRGTLRERRAPNQGSINPMEKAVGGSPPPRRSLRRRRGGLRSKDDDQPEFANHRESSLQPLDGNQLGPIGGPDNFPRSVQHHGPDPPRRTVLPKGQGTPSAGQLGTGGNYGRLRTNSLLVDGVSRRPLRDYLMGCGPSRS